jgi:PRC-barrel domain
MQIKASDKRLRSLKDLERYRILAADGDIGRVYDFFFDDESWVLRYLVVDTGHWLPGRKVLLPPLVLESSDQSERRFAVPLTREQVKDSPGVDTEKPVSRQHEIELHMYYGWPFYWSGVGAWPAPMTPIPPAAMPPRLTGEANNPHLRSVREIIGYGIEARDSQVGQVEDFIADDETWTIRYLVVGTRVWLGGRKVLVSPEWITGPIRWADRTVKIIMTGENIKHSPEFDPGAPVNREYESKLYDFYGHLKYWTKPKET